MHPLQLFESLIAALPLLESKGTKKVLLECPGGTYIRYSVDLLQTENYLIVYKYSKGSHWNLGGNHYKYYHDIKTGLFIAESKLPASAFKEKTIAKEKITVAIYNKLFKLLKAKVTDTEVIATEVIVTELGKMENL